MVAISERINTPVLPQWVSTYFVIIIAETAQSKTNHHSPMKRKFSLESDASKHERLSGNRNIISEKA
jgi:hypothetical protein